MCTFWRNQSWMYHKTTGNVITNGTSDIMVSWHGGVMVSLGHVSNAICVPFDRNSDL